MTNVASIAPVATIPRVNNTSFESTTVILVRHGRTTYNQQGRYQGSSDVSVLTAKGHQDALATGLALQDYHFDAIYTSPLTRVRQTTDAILTAFDAEEQTPPVFIDSLLTEISMSAWQGLSYREVRENFPTAYDCWQHTPHLFTFGNGVFPVLELFEQAQRFWQQLLTKHRGQTVLVVAHGGTNRALISTAVGLSPEYYHVLQQSNCGISCLEFPVHSQVAELKYLNSTHHLPENLPKLKAGKTGWRWLLVSKEIASNLHGSDRLTQLIARDSIDLVLSDDSPDAELLASTLRENNRQLLHLSVAQNRFLERWQQQIVRRQATKATDTSTKLVTGLIVASECLIAQILAKTLTTTTTLDIKGSLAVIHYPQQQQHSILQGILPLNYQFATTSSKS